MSGRRSLLGARAAIVVAVFLLGLVVVPTADLAKKGPPLPCPAVILPSLTVGASASSPLAVADPCPGLILTLETSNIAVAIQSSPPFKSQPALQVWQSVDSSNYAMNWFAEVRDVGQYNTVTIGNVDDDPQREIVAFDSEQKTTKVKGQRTTEYRVLFDVYEEGSTGFPDRTSEYIVRSSNAFIIYALVENVDADPLNEVVAIVHDQLVIYGYDAAAGEHVVEFLSEPLIPVLGSSLREFDIGDVDGDGQLEIVTPVVGRGTVLVWSRDGSGWSYAESPAAPNTVKKGRVGDIDGDGDLEIVVHGYDTDTRISYLFVWTWNPTTETYDLDHAQPFDLPGDDVFWGFELANVDRSPDGSEELALGTSGGSGRAMVMAFDQSAREWKTIWSAETGAVANSVNIGDADGNPGTVELVFVGGKDGLYIEVFTWLESGNTASSSWMFTGEFRTAWDGDVG